MGVGDSVQLFDGQGGLAEAKIAAVARGAVELEVATVRRVAPRETGRIVIAVSVAKGERFEHAVKCGPTLVLPGGRANKLKSVSRHARTAVGRDKSGRLFFVLTERGRLTYADLTKVLLDDAIDADYAFNLDGGSSVSYCYRTPDGKVHERHGVPVSSVILVLAP